MHLKACHACGRIHEIPIMKDEERACCVRCGATISDPAHARRSAGRTAAFALGAFLLFWPGILMPILHVERLGYRQDTGIMHGSLQLLLHGNMAVGAALLIFVIAVPLIKIALLLELSLLQMLRKEDKILVYRILEVAGKWSMLDVFAMALLIMLVQIGNVVQLTFGPAALALVMYVIMSIAATWSFDPHIVWGDE